MDKKLDDQKNFIQYSIDNNKKVTNQTKEYCDDLKKKMNKNDLEYFEIKALLNKVLGQNQISLPGNMDSPKSQYPSTEVLSNKKDT